MCGRTLTCAATYEECTEEIYCPYAGTSRQYTLSADSYLCGDGPQICVSDPQMCQSTACGASYA